MKHWVLMWHCPHAKAESSCGTGTCPCSVSVSVSPPARTGSCTSSHLLPGPGVCIPGDGMGEANPCGHRLLPLLCVEIPEPRQDKSAVWGPHGTVGLHLDFWGGVCRARAGHWGAPSSPPAMAWEAGGTFPLGSTSARFPGNLKQSKSSPRHASPSSVAGGHRGELRGEQAEGNQNSFFAAKCAFSQILCSACIRGCNYPDLPSLSARAGCCPTLGSLSSHQGEGSLTLWDEQRHLHHVLGGQH